MMLIPVGLPLASRRFVMLTFRPTKSDMITLVPDVPPTQLKVTSPTCSAKPSAWTVGVVAVAEQVWALREDPENTSMNSSTATEIMPRKKVAGGV